MTYHAASERHLLSMLRENYEARGYTFIEHPGASLLPVTFGRYRPDAIAVRDTDKFAIEVKLGGASSNRLEEISAAVSGSAGWKLHVISPGESGDNEPFSGPGILDFDEKLREIDTLVSGRHYVAAFLFAWGVFEAAALRRLTSRYAVDAADRRTPNSLIAMLETYGELSSEDAREIASLNRSRNALAHGNHQSPPTEAQLRDLAGFIRRLASEGAHQT
jgi:hypothetical protein